MAFRRRTGEQAQPELSALSPAEVQWRENQFETARLIVERYNGTAVAPPRLSDLEAALLSWRADDPTRIDVNTLVNAVGITFGQHLVDALGLEWVIATDAQGSDLALHGQPGDLLLYPANLVAKRIVAEEATFLQRLFDELVARTRTIERSPRAARTSRR